MLRTLLPALLIAGCSEYDLTSRSTAGHADNPEDVDVQIPDGLPTGGVTGRVCAPDGETWVVGANVWIEHEWGTSETQTGQDGWFTLEGLPPGVHVVHIEKGKFGTQVQVEVYADKVTELPFYECINQGDVKIAVVTGQYDHIEDLIGDLNLTFDLIQGMSSDQYISFLRDPEWMAEYDLIFFNCGMGWDWSLQHEDEIAANIRDYVNAGGSVYASDWAYWIVEASWPAQQEFHGGGERGDALRGARGTVVGDVRDPAMVALLGSPTAQLHYDLDWWAAPVSTNGQVLIEGTYNYLDPAGSRYAPLAFRMSNGGGAVTYTSFHNEHQTTMDMIKLLQEIILAL